MKIFFRGVTKFCQKVLMWRNYNKKWTVTGGVNFLDRKIKFFIPVCGAVLRIRIRDPVPFWPLDPGSGTGRKSASTSGIRMNYLEGPPFLLLPSATWKGWLLLFIGVGIPGRLAFLLIVVHYLEGPPFSNCRQIPGRVGFYSLLASGYLEDWLFSSLLSNTWRGRLISYWCQLPGRTGFYSLLTLATWNAGFSLHCRQLPRGAEFSLIDVSYLEEQTFTLHWRQIAGMPVAAAVVAEVTPEKVATATKLLTRWWYRTLSTMQWV
jgi:hypothetical protein